MRDYNEEDHKAFETCIRAVCQELADMLVAKNKAYGNSVLDPIQGFSRATVEERILMRLDDKLSRLVDGKAAGEDVILDMIGYLILLLVYARGLLKKRKGV